MDGSTAYYTNTKKLYQYQRVAELGIRNAQARRNFLHFYPQIIYYQISILCLKFKILYYIEKNSIIPTIMITLII